MSAKPARAEPAGQPGDGAQAPYDVAIVGGGPAGSGLATLLARRGRSVVVFERDQHPRFHVGESLLPGTLPILRELGVLDRVAGMGTYKPGAEFVCPGYAERRVFRFADALRPDPPHAYQVERAPFDALLLANAGASGAEVHEGTEVVDAAPKLGDGRLSVRPAAGGETRRVRARYIVDCSGRDGVLARRLANRSPDRSHNTAAIFAHLRGVPTERWGERGNIAVVWFDHGWVWMIPLADGRVSVGAVCGPAYFKRRQGSLEDFYTETLRQSPEVWDLVKDAERVTPVRGAGNYSYRADRMHGDGFLLLGDSFAFIDPVFSSGVHLALTGARSAAPAIDRVLDAPARQARELARHQRLVEHDLARLSWFIRRFDTPAMRRLFMEPRNWLGVRTGVLSVLAGDTRAGLGLDLRLGAFRMFYWLETRRGRPDPVARAAAPAPAE